MRWLTACAAAMLTVPASAAVVVDPFPPIPAGLTAAIQRFTTVPPTAADVPRTGLQQLKGPADGSGRIFVNDTRGVLYVTTRAGATPTPYLDLRTQGIGFSNAANPSQTGLMSFAFHPNFGVDRTQPGYDLFYTFDTTAAAPGSGASHQDVLREWTVADPKAPVAQVTGRRELLSAAQPRSDHGPGTIAFDPTARAGAANFGKLFVSLGDGGGVNDPDDNAQNPDSPFGKILRFDPLAPGGIGPIADAVFASGLRNPQHFSWAPDGTMYIADIGQAQVEEVNVIPAGATSGGNFGWPFREGDFAKSADKADLNIYDDPNPGFVDPLAQYDHQEILAGGVGGASVSGVFRYTGTLFPELAGSVILSDLVSGRLFYFDANDPAGFLRELLLTIDGQSTSFLDLAGLGRNRADLRLGVDAGGELFFLTKGNGDIYRFAGALPEDAVPEPAAWAMMALGFGLAGAALRRRRRRATA